MTADGRTLKKRLSDLRIWLRESPGILLTSLALRWLRWVRGEKLHRMPRMLALIDQLGVFPLADHYYEPIVRRSRLDPTWTAKRSLPGIELDLEAQWQLLESFDYRDELLRLGNESYDPNAYDSCNPYFRPGDADFYYSIIRRNKPARIIEIGSGHCTRLACAASRANEAEEPSRRARIVCIEPYSNEEMLAALDVERIRIPVEEIELDLFASLEANDILFIDSSHMVRPEGDVLYEIQQILPRLAKGVWIHFHDIFTPRDYPPQWLIDRMYFWNEQYVLEAFLAFNPGFRIVAALNHLQSLDPERFERALPLSAAGPAGATASFWLVRN